MRSCFVNYTSHCCGKTICNGKLGLNPRKKNTPSLKKVNEPWKTSSTKLQAMNDMKSLDAVQYILVIMLHGYYKLNNS